MRWQLHADCMFDALQFARRLKARIRLHATDSFDFGRICLFSRIHEYNTQLYFAVVLKHFCGFWTEYPDHTIKRLLTFHFFSEIADRDLLVNEEIRMLSLHHAVSGIRECGNQSLPVFTARQHSLLICYAKRCTSYRKSVCLSVRLPQSGTVSKRRKLGSWDLHWRIAPWLVSSCLTAARNSKGNLGSEAAKWERDGKRAIFSQ